MTLYQFNSKEINAKAEYVWEYCNYIGNMITGKSIKMLYGNKLDQTFFVEIELLDNKIIDIGSFIIGEELEKYLNCIDVEKIINK